MPTYNFYISDEDLHTIILAEVAEDGDVLPIPVIAARLMRWFAKMPTAPSRSAAIAR